MTADRPALLERMDGHGALANSAALKLAGIDEEGPADPAGGTIERDAGTRRPTGILKDAAIGLVERHVPSPSAQQRYDAVLAAMQSNALYGRPDNYYETLADKYRALDTAGVDTALAGMLNVNALTFVVVGDAKTIKGQLDKLGYPVEVVAAR